MNEVLKELGVTYIATSWFSSNGIILVTFQLDKTGETFHDIKIKDYYSLLLDIERYIKKLENV